MPRASNISVQNNFTRGLITEATGLTFPENACTDSDNCVFNHFGIAERRLGLDFEDSFTAFTESVDGDVIVTYLWDDVAGEGDISFVVVQIGDNLHFYRVASDAALSDGKHATVLALSTFFPAGITTVSTIECQFSSGNGILFVTNPRLDSFYVEYNPSANTFAATELNIQVRDFEGDTADTETVTSRPTTTLGAMDDNHQYNLQNQGWTDVVTVGTLQLWDAARTDMPSNADVSWYYKNSSNAFDFAGQVNNREIGNSPAPKGHFIYNIYNFNRSSNVSGATNSSIATDRLQTSAFFAGRVFYAGLKAPKHSSRIYFTQIVEEVSQYGKCYQTNDPTSELLFDLLPSDGGVIDILEAGAILKMVPVLNTLIVVATNGVWAIGGSQGVGFTANDYSINKISSITNISHTSFVDVEGIPYWWNLEGIYRIKLDPQSNSIRVESVSDATIRTFFLTIPSESKQFVRGTYDQFSKRVQWIYKSVESDSFNDKYVYDRMLTLNLLSNAFYEWSVDVSDVHVNSIVNVFGFGGAFESNNVVNGANNVVNNGNQVIVFLAENTNITSTIKYFVSYTSAGDKVTWAECYKDSYLDWESFDSVGVEYESFFVTGYVVRGQGIRKFQTNYVNMFSDASEDTTYKIVGLWDYATLADSGQWSVSQRFTPQTFNNDQDLRYAYRMNRIKLRGHGRACQFRIFNSGTEPFRLIGWSVWETGNQKV